jgi:hypothetical protein
MQHVEAQLSKVNMDLGPISSFGRAGTPLHSNTPKSSGLGFDWTHAGRTHRGLFNKRGK